MATTPLRANDFPPCSFCLSFSWTRLRLCMLYRAAQAVWMFPLLLSTLAWVSIALLGYPSSVSRSCHRSSGSLSTQHFELKPNHIDTLSFEPFRAKMLQALLGGRYLVILCFWCFNYAFTVV